jgi:SpoVK/Ycf46/Vps4 family AAA+-type ATPase
MSEQSKKSNVNSLTKFIEKLENLNENSLIKSYVTDFNELITSLKKLDSMIGMNEVKKNIISQIKYYFVNKSRKVHSLDKQEFFHTTLLGPPGSGKTTVAEHLADIWMSLGVLNPKCSTKKDNELDEDKIKNSKLYSNLKNENEKISKNLSEKESELSIIHDKFKIMKEDIFYQKKTIDNMLNHLEDVKNIIPIDIYNTLKDNLISYEYKIDAMLKSNYFHKQLVIEKVDEKDFDPINLIDDSSTDTDISDCKNDITISFLKDNPFELPSIFNKNFAKFNNKEPEENINSKVVKLRRDDLVGKFVGHTAIKTREALMKGIGKVIFLDEAYELYNTSFSDGGDSFGMECLNTLLHFINEYSDKCIIIFAGYEDLLKKTIFKVQPGLERRIGWTFNISPYNHSELASIYEKQLRDKSWNIRQNHKDRINELFRKNFSLFKNGGGDTLRLALYTKTVYSDLSFIKLLEDEELDKDITYEVVNKAIEVLRENIENQGEKKEFLSYYL